MQTFWVSIESAHIKAFVHNRVGGNDTEERDVDGREMMVDR